MADRPTVLGNLGLNTQCRASDTEPAELVYKDFDNNGRIDPVLCLYVQEKSYPHATRDELLNQMSMLCKRFTNYETYPSATLTDVFTPDELQDASQLTANQFRTTGFRLTSDVLPVGNTLLSGINQQSMRAYRPVN